MGGEWYLGAKSYTRKFTMKDQRNWEQACNVLQEIARSRELRVATPPKGEDHATKQKQPAKSAPSAAEYSRYGTHFGIEVSTMEVSTCRFLLTGFHVCALVTRPTKSQGTSAKFLVV
jgi:hypothetical protein